jgi:thiamine pyrophosphate-dependent acetolactate synthase large subunit-like protein
MTGQEVSVGVRDRLPVTYIVLNNRVRRGAVARVRDSERAAGAARDALLTRCPRVGVALGCTARS